MSIFQLQVNGSPQKIETDPNKPLLWVLREDIGLMGTKYGCGIGMCGACTVHLDGKAIRSCQTPISAVGNRKVTTIEGIGRVKLHPVQEAWIELQVPQCGYCQSGQIMSAVALLSEKPNPQPQEIDAAMNGNLCRCATYDRIKKAIVRTAEKLTNTQNDIEK